MHASNNKASETWSKIDRIKKEVSKFTNIDLYSNSFNHSVINRTRGEKKNQDTIWKYEWLYQPAWLNWHSQNPIPNNCCTHVLFKCTGGPFTRIDHILGLKTSLKIFQGAKIIESIFSNFARIKINDQNIFLKVTNIEKLGNILPYNTWVK